MWGLAVHPKNQTFFTVGEDQLLAQWDAKKHQMLNWKRLDYHARTIAVHPEGKILAVGCTNGAVLIIDASTLLISLSFKDRDQNITAIKFSPDTGDKLALAYGSPHCEIMIYDTKSFKQEHKIRGSQTPITSMDFNSTGKVNFHDLSPDFTR